MKTTGNPHLTRLIERVDRQQLQARLSAAQALEAVAETELAQLEQSIADLNECSPSTTLLADQPSVHAQFDLSDELGGSPGDFVAPLLANRLRLRRNLESCRRQTQQAEAAAEPQCASQRQRAVQNLLEHWIFEEINASRRNAESLTLVNLDDYEPAVVQLLCLVLSENRRLSCCLEDGQLTVVV